MLYPYLHDLLRDRKGGEVFVCFGLWHILYILLIFGAIALVLFFGTKNDNLRRRVPSAVIGLAFGLYVLDFFLMPLAYGQIDLEKLPFHMCTAICVLCFLSRHSARLEGFRTSFAILGLASNLIYVIYPAGVGWQQIHPLCYRTVQTLLFHGVMTGYGIFTLAFETKQLKLSHCRRTLPVIVGMTLWAMLGNAVYNGQAGEYDHFFNWFFVVRDPFYLLPAEIAPYVMPFVMVAVMYVATMLICGGYFVVRKLAVSRKDVANTQKS